MGCVLPQLCPKNSAQTPNPKPQPRLQRSNRASPALLPLSSSVKLSHSWTQRPQHQADCAEAGVHALPFCSAPGSCPGSRVSETHPCCWLSALDFRHRYSYIFFLFNFLTFLRSNAGKKKEKIFFFFFSLITAHKELASTQAPAPAARPGSRAVPRRWQPFRRAAWCCETCAGWYQPLGSSGRKSSFSL